MLIDTAIVWLRRDLRLEDNPALTFALRRCRSVVLLYVYSPSEEAPWQPGSASNWWLHHSLQAFIKSIARYNVRLLIRRGNSLETILDISNQTGAKAVFWNRLYEPTMVKRDKYVKSQLRANDIETASFNGALLKEPWEISKADGSMYRVFTPFSRQYLDDPAIRPLHPGPDNMVCGAGELTSLSVEDLKLLPAKTWYSGFADLWQPGEVGAMKQMNRFLDDALTGYDEGRNIPSIEGVSMLSAHLHFGEISPVQVWCAARFQADSERGYSSGVNLSEEKPYLKQLVWRDFAHHILFHLPQTVDQPFNEKFAGFQWESNPEFLDAWKKGRTGIPLVDAGMRQLWQTGWMHNRIRMLVASVLTKNGLVHWQEGAQWFWETLVDANLANNSMGWQWTAGCGVDAAPYFRVFSPTRQGQRFDPMGEYIRKWVPELESVPNKFIHEPWNSSDFSAKSYPGPIVDLSKSRKRALEKYRLLRTTGQAPN